MTEIELIVALVGVMLALVVLARRLAIAYPILLVIAGLVLAAIPIWPEIDLDPELVFTVFLPPILFSAAYNTSWRDFRRQLAPIGSLAVGLVLVTMAGVAVVAQAVIPGMSWAAAFVLGAIVSPPDAVATVAIVQRLGVPKRITTVLEGESLVNDATALVAYRFAVAAVVTGTFTLWRAGFEFVIDAAGGIAIGLIVGRLAIWAVPRVGHEGAIIATFVAAIASYTIAETVTVSGVLATVATGLVFGRYLPTIGSPQLRLQITSIWNIVVFVINGLVFILIGLQLQPVVEGITQWSRIEVLQFAAIISATAIVIRIVWVFTATFLLHLLAPHVPLVRRVPSAATATVVAWAGLRGVVTLATAMALPRLTADGSEFAERELIICLAFAVIVVTLLGQGLTLGPLVNRLHLTEDDAAMREELLARRQAAEAALRRIDALSGEDWVPQQTARMLRARYERQLKRLPGTDGTGEGRRRLPPMNAQIRLNQEATNAEREAVIALRNSGQISDEVLHKMSRELDLAESRPLL